MPARPPTETIVSIHGSCFSGVFYGQFEVLFEHPEARSFTPSKRITNDMSELLSAKDK